MVEHSDTTPARREDTSPAGEHTTADQPETASGGSLDSQPGRARHEQRGRRRAAAYRAAIVGCRFAGLFAAKALRGHPGRGDDYRPHQPGKRNICRVTRASP